MKNIRLAHIAPVVVIVVLLSVITLFVSSCEGGIIKGNLTWSDIKDEKAMFSDKVKRIAWGNNKFIAVGENASMAYSANGSTWTVITPEQNTFMAEEFKYNINGIVYGNNKFVAVGSGGRMAYSSDGIKWTGISYEQSTFLGDIYVITYGNNLFVAYGIDMVLVGNDPGRWESYERYSKIAYSSDGQNWTTAYRVKDGKYINQIVWGKDKFVAVGQNGIIMNSPDGINWTIVAEETSGFNSGMNPGLDGLTWGNDVFVAGGAGQIIYSFDGVTWTPVEADQNVFRSGRTVYGIDNIVFGNNIFIAVGSRMGKSSDGINWTRIAEEENGINNLFNFQITWGRNKFVGMGTDHRGKEYTIVVGEYK
ncbi:MAG: hypothetical protein FWC01_08525 [Treponema sp.]|nr:hypothetical protein [Treponema sp.]MCL2237981.1 hypothetical protein [Treponema sp.]